MKLNIRLTAAILACASILTSASACSSQNTSSATDSKNESSAAESSAAESKDNTKSDIIHPHLQKAPFLPMNHRPKTRSLSALTAFRQTASLSLT